MEAGEVPDYCVFQSAGSRRKQNFIVGNGNKVPNRGAVHLNLDAEVGGQTNSLKSVFQMAAITRQLISVRRITDQGLVCIFDRERALVKNQDGKVVCEFTRKGGLYVTEMTLEKSSAEGDTPTNATPFGTGQ